MLVPSTRLLVLFGFVALPLIGLAGLFPLQSGVWLGLLAGLFAVMAIDGIRSRSVLQRVEVQLPLLVRLASRRPGEIFLSLKNSGGRPVALRIGLPFPEVVTAETEIANVELPVQENWSRLAWKCEPQRRGQYFLRQVFLESPSPWGIWLYRRTVPAPCELRVYPGLHEDRKRVSALFLNRGQFGVHAVRQVGKGRDFESLREYLPGDGYDEISWKATARRGRPVTKVFQIERTQEVYVMIDSSRLSARETILESPTGKGSNSSVDAATKSFHTRMVVERYVNAAMMIFLAAQRQGDLFGCLVYSDGVDRFLRAKNGKEHYGTCRDALYNIQPRRVAPDYSEVISFIRLRLRRRALLIFLTSLEDPVIADQFSESIALISRQHLVMAAMLKPPEAATLFSPQKSASVDDIYQHLGGHLLWQRLEELKKVLQRRGVRFFQLTQENLSAELVSEYLQVKKRQLL